MKAQIYSNHRLKKKYNDTFSDLLIPLAMIYISCNHLKLYKNRHTVFYFITLLHLIYEYLLYWQYLWSGMCCLGDNIFGENCITRYIRLHFQYLFLKCILCSSRDKENQKTFSWFISSLKVS